MPNAVYGSCTLCATSTLPQTPSALLQLAPSMRPIIMLSLSRTNAQLSIKAWNASRSAISFTPGFTRSDATLGNAAARPTAPAKWQRAREAAAHAPSARECVPPATCVAAGRALPVGAIACVFRAAPAGRHKHLPHVERRLQLASAMLDRLFTDLVLYVLALTDVYTILSLSRVNKFFHSITLAKHLWIPIVRDLVMRGLSDFPPDEDLRVYSAEALVEEVKRAVAGPHTWSPQFESGPTIYREVKLEYAVPGGDGLRSTQWLPGGRHVLFEYSVLVGNIRTTWLRCWEIIAAQCREVWDITCVGILVAAAFDFRTGSKLIVSLVLNDAHGFSFILLLEVDLSTGVSSSLFQLGPTIVWPWRVRISDDYMAWQGASGDSIIVLINWLSGEFIAFESTERRASFELFPGHILLAYPTSRASTPCSVHLYSIASLDHLWRPVSEFNFHDHNIRSSLHQ
ncbi:hypothetical protein GGX14DRAFT_572838 [Mycena pura]|uniref:F-box domain-containing protein n=1 Tax=Mycena pura TaxID=153505 RepID=A0AAD6V0V6_9AGAR|nr:hypothetical protein GGX14DRAFT_572838 [Mycena pura]